MELSKVYTYEELMSFIHKLKKEYPDYLELACIGITFEKREIPMLIFGNDAGKCAVFTGGVHARETINPPVLLAMAEDCLEKIKKDSVKAFSGKVYLIPLLNPDGYEKARSEEPLWKSNAKGVDINRNFPSRNFKKKYADDFPASECETKALIRVFHDINPDGYLDYHSRGKSIFYYRNQMDKVYNCRQKDIADALSQITGYTLEEPEDEIDPFDSGGNTVHYFSEIFNKPALTIETVCEQEHFPLKEKLQKETYKEIKDTFEVFLTAL